MSKLQTKMKVDPERLRQSFSVGARGRIQVTTGETRGINEERKRTTLKGLNKAQSATPGD
jgi:hypothetical protein